MTEATVIYHGEFRSREGVRWGVEICTPGDEPAAAGELAVTGLRLEWDRAAKLDVLCGSRATLTVLSPGDRTYEGLYRIKPGEVWLRVYRAGGLYWCGALDPEFYEEPYERDRDYEVTLVFADFGIFERLKYELDGMRTMADVLGDCLGRARVECAVDESLVSTRLGGGAQPMSLGDVSVRSDNFYDEDGEAMALKDVLEGMMLPLGLKLVQRCGRVWVYDLNGLWAGGERHAVRWNGDRSTLGVDVVYNNVKLTWDPYAQSGVLTGDECWDAVTDPDVSVVAPQGAGGWAVGDARIWTYPVSPTADDLSHMPNPGTGDTGCPGFTLWTTEAVKGVELLDGRLCGYRVMAQYSGQDGEGVLVTWPEVWVDATLGQAPVASLRYERRGLPLTGLQLAGKTAATRRGRLLRSERVWLPHVRRGMDVAVRLAMDLRMDPRVNPYEDAVTWPRGRWGESSVVGREMSHANWMADWDRHGRLVYVPVSVYFRPDGGDELWCWSNREAVEGDGGYASLSTSMGTWRRVSDAGDDDYGYLCYYSKSDRSSRAAVTGGCTNRQAVPPLVTCRVERSIADADDGQYVEFPNMGTRGGELWMEVHGDGWLLRDGGWDLRPADANDFGGLWDKVCWIMLGVPAIEIVNNRPFGREIDADNVEYSAVINADAKDAFERETICGTAADGVATARGAYFETATGAQITELTRGGRTTQAEELLIGTVYSQHAGRMVTLSGEMDVLTEGVCVYEDGFQPGRVFMVSGDVQDVAQDTSEAELTELRPDEYDKANE